MMLLAGDIGGTKTTLALFTPEGGLEPRVQTSFKSNEYPSLAAVAAQFLGETGVSVDKAVFGVVGPVAVAPHMLARGSGKIVHVAARAALAGVGKAAAYSASKAATVRLVESLAAELRQENINVNCVLPGTIDTPQNRQALAAMPKADHSRWVPPEAIADVILFLASDAAWAVNGAAVPVYGQS